MGRMKELLIGASEEFSVRCNYAHCGKELRADSHTALLQAAQDEGWSINEELGIAACKTDYEGWLDTLPLQYESHI